MKNILTIFLFISLFLFNNSLSAKIKNKIVVKIENQIITNYEIKNKILVSLILDNKEINQENINNLKNQTLENLILLKLKKIELKKTKLEKDSQKINSYLNFISSNDIIGLKKKFSINKLDFNLFMEEVEIELMWQDYIYNIYSDKIQIDEKNLENEINEITSNTLQSNEYNLSEIELLTSNSEENKENIQNVLNLLEQEEFEDVANNFSVSTTSKDGGNLGWINSKSLSKDIRKEIEKLNVGDISKPIIKNNTILILKLIDKRLVKTSDKNKSDLRKKLINQKRSQLFNLYSLSHLSKIKNNSLVEYIK